MKAFVVWVSGREAEEYHSVAETAWRAVLMAVTQHTRPAPWDYIQTLVRDTIQCVGQMGVNDLITVMSEHAGETRKSRIMRKS